ncbi:peptidase M16 [Pararhodospirillum oryzae]|uniref:Peptidase M16 n=1 Tax=Pararhodospirillum oryzae TaxID=478448 RepID=A0A512HAV3_9PROT|nr:peptidase M16 [Pararhodospirillum oryzae]
MGLTLGLVAHPGPAPAQVFNPETFTLGNGLQVVVLPDHRAPVVHQMVWYKVGAADEPPGKTGLAHLLEHLMFKGTKSIPPGEFSRRIARNGGQDNAFTGDDYTAYYQSIARDRLELVMGMEADRMAHLRLSEDDFQTEREVVREERRQRTDTDPSALLGERLGQILWGTHPYHNPVIGWDDDLTRLTRADALDFYAHYYAPNNAVLIIAGDVDVARVRALAEKTFGAVAARPTPERRRPGTLPPAADVVVTMHHPQVHQPELSRLYVAPSRSADPQGFAPALAVLADLLGGGSTSRLYRALVVDQPLAVSVAAWYRTDALDFGTFTLGAVPHEGVETTALARALDDQIQRLLNEGVSDDEVARARHRLTAGLIYARDSLSEGARVLGSALSTGGSIDTVETWPDRIRAVTPDQVMAAARAVLGQRDHAVTGLLLPAVAALAPSPSASEPPASGDRP